MSKKKFLADELPLAGRSVSFARWLAAQSADVRAQFGRLRQRWHAGDLALWTLAELYRRFREEFEFPHGRSAFENWLKEKPHGEEKKGP